MSRPLIFVSRIFISTQTESPLLYLSLLLLFCIVPSKSFPWLTTIPHGRDLPFWFIHSRHNGNEQRIIFCSFPTILHKEFHVDKQSRPLIIFMIPRTKPGHTRFSSGIPFGTACPRVLYVIDWQHQYSSMYSIINSQEERKQSKNKAKHSHRRFRLIYCTTLLMKQSKP